MNFRYLTLSVAYANLMRLRAREEIESFLFVLKRCGGAKYTDTRDLDLRHAQRHSIPTLRIAAAYTACSTSFDVGRAIAQNRV